MYYSKEEREEIVRFLKKSAKIIVIGLYERLERNNYKINYYNKFKHLLSSKKYDILEIDWKEKDIDNINNFIDEIYSKLTENCSSKSITFLKEKDSVFEPWFLVEENYKNIKIYLYFGTGLSHKSHAIIYIKYTND